MPLFIDAAVVYVDADLPPAAMPPTYAEPLLRDIFAITLAAAMPPLRLSPPPPLPLRLTPPLPDAAV